MAPVGSEATSKDNFDNIKKIQNSGLKSGNCKWPPAFAIHWIYPEERSYSHCEYANPLPELYKYWISDVVNALFQIAG